MQRYSEPHLKVIRQILRAYPEVREGTMFGYPAFFVGRRMFACVYGEGVGIKLPAEEVARLLTLAGTIAFRPHGKRQMREWVQINRPRSAHYRRDIAVLEKSIRFVAGGARK